MTLALNATPDGRLSPLRLYSATEHDYPGPDFSNLAIDPGSGVIEDYRKTGGAGDCGVRRRWGWTGRSFTPLSEHFMPSCFGAAHSQWLRMHMTSPADPMAKVRPPC